MAVTRQVDLMNKWKAVDTADEGLLSVRAQYQEKMVEFAERWSKVSATRFLFLFGCCCLFIVNNTRLRRVSWR